MGENVNRTKEGWRSLDQRVLDVALNWYAIAPCWPYLLRAILRAVRNTDTAGNESGGKGHEEEIRRF